MISWSSAKKVCELQGGPGTEAREDAGVPVEVTGWDAELQGGPGTEAREDGYVVAVNGVVELLQGGPGTEAREDHAGVGLDAFEEGLASMRPGHRGPGRPPGAASTTSAPAISFNEARAPRPGKTRQEPYMELQPGWSLQGGPGTEAREDGSAAFIGNPVPGGLQGGPGTEAREDDLLALADMVEDWALQGGPGTEAREDLVARR